MRERELFARLLEIDGRLADVELALAALALAADLAAGPSAAAIAELVQLALTGSRSLRAETEAAFGLFRDSSAQI